MPLKISIFFFLLSVIFLISCKTENVSTHSHPAQIEKIAKEYFQTFAERKNWDKLLSFYADDMTFHDVMLHLELDSLWQFQRFYNWPDTNFQKLSADQQHLILEDLAISENLAVGRGHFNPFFWHGEKMGPGWGMEFCIWLYFNDAYKIQRQVDWIEYDTTVLENVIKRYRTEGIDKVPGWLDLSKN